MLLQLSLLLLLIMEGIFAEECQSNTCYNRGACYDEKEITCICETGFTGNRCQYKAVDCVKKECIQGSCVNDHCVCEAGYAGDYCQYPDQCDKNPCRDHGKCLSVENRYQCLCDKGYTSGNCENDINECEVSPNICQNNGVCENTDGSFNCKCPSGFSGKLCGYSVNFCTTNPCLNGGRCVNAVDNFRCECPPTFSGALCEKKATDCGCKHGRCYQDTDYCTCDFGWKGYLCDEPITSCSDNPCQNGTQPSQISKCRNYFAAGKLRLHCNCAEGLSGTFCDKKVNPCDRNPCRSRGNCTALANGDYSCECNPGFTAKNCEDDINECEDESLCRNGAQCQNYIGGYKCICQAGFDGFLCENNINDCIKEPCQNGGTCVDGVNDYTCKCAPGYTGKNCEVNIDECEDNPCPHYSTCVDKINYYQCICNPGSEDLPSCERDEDECTQSLCKNGGSCIDLPGDYRCQCLDGYSGRNCEFDDTPCGEKPCVHGTCYAYNMTSYVCNCHPGYEGKNCETNFNECLRFPCRNGAKCIDRVNDYQCNCPPEFTGKNCNLNARYCENNPCFNNGVCTPDTLRSPFYTCRCPAGYKGSRCELEVSCKSSHCNNRGKCIDLGDNKYKCICDKDYSGAYCQSKSTPCGSTQCYNGGVCVRGECQCKPGFSSPDCRDNPVATCGDAPCLNGGTCISTGAGFVCRCKPGYSGPYCQVLSSSGCPPSFCQNGGSCFKTDNGYHCSCGEGFSGKFCENRDYCSPNPCLRDGFVCENFPPDNPQQYLCCEDGRAICYGKDGCLQTCEATKNNSICEPDCYNEHCTADVHDCTQNTGAYTNPWTECSEASRCSSVFNNGVCNSECNNRECNYDGMDCRGDYKAPCEYDAYCKKYYNNGYCDMGCNNTQCYYDGTDCTDEEYAVNSEGAIQLTVNVGCRSAKLYKGHITRVLDIWTGSLSIIESYTNTSDDTECELIIGFDERYCKDRCVTWQNRERYLTAYLQSKSSYYPTFPFKVAAIKSAASKGPNKTGPEPISTAIITSIAVVAILLILVGMVVGRNVFRARARMWTPDDFTKSRRKSNIKDISKMGDIHMKTIPQDPNFAFYLDQQINPIMDVELDPMYMQSVSSKLATPYEEDEKAPMITQAAYEYRQREDTASPTTQFEEQIATGRGRMPINNTGREESPLHRVSRNNDVDALKHLLISAAVDINSLDNEGRTPLYAAVGADAVDVVDILLSVDGIDVDRSKSQCKTTPLMLAARMNFNTCLEKLLRNNPQINQVDSWGKSALHWASAVGNIQAIELLLKRSANKDCETAKKETPLFLAAREGKLEAVKLLVSNNAARHIADHTEKRPVDVARERLHNDIVDILMTWNTDGNAMIRSIPHIPPAGSLTPPQSDDAATGSPNSLPTLSPCEREASKDDKKGNNKRKKKKTDLPTPHSSIYPPTNGVGFWAKNQNINSPPLMSTQLLSPESLQGSPNSSTTYNQGYDPHVEGCQQRLTHYPFNNCCEAISPYIPQEQYLQQQQQQQQHKPQIKPFNQIPQVEYNNSSPDSMCNPEEWNAISNMTSPPNSDWSHTSP